MIYRRTFLTRASALGALIAARGILGASRARAATVVFADSFKRASTSRGWGKPWFNQRRGLAWGIARGKGFVDLPRPQAEAGRYNPNPIIALDHDVADLDLRAKMSTSNAGIRFGLIGRVVGYSDYYGVYLDRSQIKISNFGVARENELARARFTVAARTPYWVRLKISGRGPVLIQAKVWKASRSEPARWTVQTSHTGPGKLIVRRGSFGFVVIHDDVNKRSGRVKVSGVKAVATDLQRKSAPEATFAFAGRLQPATGGRYRARVVARSDIPATIAFEVGTDPRLRTSSIVSATEVVPKANVAKTWLQGLDPGSTVYWRPLLTSRSGRLNKGLIRSFRTPPAAGQEVSFAFGSCSHTFSTSRSFDTAAALNPYFFAHLGDFGYPQNPLGSAAAAFTTGSFQDRWTRMLARRSMTNLHRRAAWIMLQDDHDYGRENCWSETVRPFTVPAFDELTGNLNDRHFDVRYGDVHCFFIDAHRYSDDPHAPDGQRHSLIGGTQKTWLKQSMSSSDAPLLILFSPMPFWGAGQGVTSWKSAFAEERKDLLSFFAGLQGQDRRVLICSGNSHAQVINRHPNGGSKDVIEFVSSETDKMLPKQLRPVAGDGVIDGTRAIKGAEAFGYVRLKAAGNNPRVELRAIDSVTGRDVWPMLAVDL